VLTITGLPHFGAHGPTKCLDAERFLEIRASPECREFRSWVRRIDSASDEEIKQQICSIRQRLGDLARSNTGKAIRVLVAAASGFLPKVGPAVGTTLAVLDMFALEKILPVSGPITFSESTVPVHL
jgi:hypothetical protein